MLDIRLIRENPSKVQEGFRKRGEAIDLSSLLKLDEERMSILKRVEDLRFQRNKASDEIKQLDVDIRSIEEQEREILLILPNIPHESVLVGKDEKGNIEIRKWGEIPRFTFEPKPHWEIGEDLDIIDFQRATNIAGAGNCLLKC